MIEEITPLIITFDEAPNIRRTLERLVWARRIVVIDSGSTDDTLRILRSYPQVVAFHRSFDDFASQCNYGLQQVQTPWVLSLDADYELSAELVDELDKLRPDKGTVGFRARFIYRIFGRPLRGTIYPPRVVLYRREHASYVNEGHGHRVTIVGNVAWLRGRIYHDDRKPLSRWLASQQLYAAQEAQYLLSHNARLNVRDHIRRWGWLAPILVLFYTLLLKGCILEGRRGWFYVMQRTVAELLIALEIIDRRLAKKSEDSER
jgi:glycosyltransferase involved in cell wall biosynthesis